MKIMVSSRPVPPSEYQRAEDLFAFAASLRVMARSYIAFADSVEHVASVLERPGVPASVKAVMHRQVCRSFDAVRDGIREFILREPLRRDA